MPCDQLACVKAGDERAAKNGFEHLGIEFEKRGSHRVGRIADQNVDLSQGFDRRGDDSLALRAVKGVAGQRNGVPSEFTNFGQNGLKCWALGAVVYGHVGSGRREHRQGTPLADAGCSARDQSLFSLQLQDDIPFKTVSLLSTDSCRGMRRQFCHEQGMLPRDLSGCRAERSWERGHVC